MVSNKAKQYTNILKTRIEKEGKQASRLERRKYLLTQALAVKDLLGLERGQQLREPSALEGDQSSVPSIHIRQLPTTCNSSPKESDALFWRLQAPAHICTHRSKNMSFFF